MIIFKLLEGQSIAFFYNGIMCFTCSCISKNEKEFHFEERLEACSYYYNKDYVGRIVCQGYKIYDENDKVILIEGNCEKKW